jgi:putative flippase GtrA
MSVMAVVRRPSPTLVAQLVRYGLVGTLNTGLTLVAYAALVAVGVPVTVAAGMGWAIGALSGYVLNRGWTFGSLARGARPAARYAAVAAVGAMLDAIGVAVLVGYDGLPHLAGEVAILPMVTALTFVLCRRWVFAGAMPA